MRYKRAILTALPFVRGENATHKVAEQVNFFSQILKMLSRASKNHDSNSTKAKIHYKRAILTAQPYVKGENAAHKVAKQVMFFPTKYKNRDDGDLSSNDFEI